MAYAPWSYDGTSNDTTAVEVVPAPASGVKRQVRKITLHNPDSGALTVIVRLKHGADTRIISRQTLSANADGEPIEHANLDDTDKSIELVLTGAASADQIDWTAAGADLT